MTQHEARHQATQETLGLICPNEVHQAKVFGVRCFKSRGMGDLYQRFVKALVDQESRAAVSRLLSENDLLPRGLFPCQGRRLGRPRRGNARIYSGAIEIFSRSSVE